MYISNIIIIEVCSVFMVTLFSNRTFLKVDIVKFLNIVKKQEVIHRAFKYFRVYIDASNNCKLKIMLLVIHS